jgi:hypothetical protein
MQETPPVGVALQCLHGSLASQQSEGGGCLHRFGFRLPGRLLPFEGRSLAVAPAGRPVLRWLAGRWPGCRYITGAYYLAI